MPVVLCVGGEADGTWQRCAELKERVRFLACNPSPRKFERVQLGEPDYRAVYRDVAVGTTTEYRLLRFSTGDDQSFVAVPAAWSDGMGVRNLIAGYQA